MRKTLQAALIAAITCAGCAIQTAHSAPATDGAPPSAPATPATPATLCQPGEVVIFSCRVRGNGKIASLCGANDFRERLDARAHYRFGTPDAIELRYPQVSTQARDRFKQGHLSFAGATGGNAYSFVNAGFKYYLYSISGTGFESQGIVVTRLDDRKVLSELECDAGSYFEAADMDVFRALEAWPEDSDIELWGLPRK